MDPAIQSASAYICGCNHYSVLDYLAPAWAACVMGSVFLMMVHPLRSSTARWSWRSSSGADARFSESAGWRSGVPSESSLSFLSLSSALGDLSPGSSCVVFVGPLLSRSAYSQP
jgi:hypothetical protein